MSIVRTQSFLPSEGGYGGGGGDEGWLKKTWGGGVAQPKGRNNCGGHRFTSGSVALFWLGGGPTPTLTIKGVSRLTGIFQRPAERKTHSQTFKTFFSPPLPIKSQTAHCKWYYISCWFGEQRFLEKRNRLNDDMVLKFTNTDWSQQVVTNCLGLIDSMKAWS